MGNILKFIRSKGPMVLIPVLIILLLVGIFVYNAGQRSGSSLITTGEGTFIEASGVAENTGVALSSEVAGTLIKSEVKEGDPVKAGQIIAVISNTTLENRYEQAKLSLEAAGENVNLLENSIENSSVQNGDMIQQSKNAYLAAEAEYQKVMDGAGSEEIKQAQEAVNQTVISLETSKKNLNRFQELLAEEAISQNQFDEAESNYNIAQTQHNAAQAKLDLLKSYPTAASAQAAENRMLQAKAGYQLARSNSNTQIQQLKDQLEVGKVQLEQAQTAMDQAEKEMDKTILKSPIDGIVSRFPFSQGELIAVGKPIAELNDPRRGEIKVYVSEANIGHVAVGQEVKLFVDSHENQGIEGRVLSINHEAEFTPKNIQTKEERVNTVFAVKIEILDATGIIKPGMPVDVKIKID
ncbi:HlyD family secretion protein [Dehalobacterium formicoaceticum]|uniref:HlyD family efflux transporter periplasmic adaptor subunit n=1 Tax=Dehalobacterium formicoaceticum TaxID=51515 RepID=A0ABT1Y3T0_9FIRM|nr:HlyD family efflux transporter periplasmic adaptor subunit [Dehalobacterium formicoaceticum]MCR6545540.1 HlyD family efflux transporter periplasmic adaptor subunit [Dehalobacterium formicoaceticum]